MYTPLNCAANCSSLTLPATLAPVAKKCSVITPALTACPISVKSPANSCGKPADSIPCCSWSSVKATQGSSGFPIALPSAFATSFPVAMSLTMYFTSRPFPLRYSRSNIFRMSQCQLVVTAIIITNDVLSFDHWDISQEIIVEKARS